VERAAPPGPVKIGGSVALALARWRTARSTVARYRLRSDPALRNVNPTEQHAREHDVLAFARCMRHRGVTDFPDPTSQGELSLETLHAAGVDVHAPAVLAAARSCLPALNGAITGADIQRAESGAQ
jgi:hypothetical protein